VAFVTLAFVAPAAADDPPRAPKAAMAGQALISVNGATSAEDEVGLYHRSQSGEMTRVWEGRPYDAKLLPDWSYLVAERSADRILLFNRNRALIFEKGGIPGPVDVEVARDGTILALANRSGEVLGIDAGTGAVLWRRGGLTNAYDVDPLPDGGLLIADSGAGRVVELDPAGKVRFEVRGLRFPNTAERLSDGRTLVTTYTHGDVLELDAEGRIVWKVHVGGTIFRAVRRPDGTTLAVDGGGGRIVTLDRAGKEIAVERFRPGCVDYEPIEEF
jgi:outer membrane protein assembly factor BamB